MAQTEINGNRHQSFKQTKQDIIFTTYADNLKEPDSVVGIATGYGIE
jgi:hypothetical protein